MHDHATAVRKERVARWSILASAALALGKLAAGLWSGSLALLSEAAHALVDTVGTLVSWYAVRTANKPADEDHQYGHGKFESVAALIETGILFLLTLAVGFQAIRHLLAGGSSPEMSWLLFVVLFISIVVDINRIRVLNKVAHETGSHALAADALHFTSDLAGSVVVVIGLATSACGFKYGDALAALGVALFIGIAGFRLARRTLNTLLDAAPKGRSERIRELVNAVPGVVGISVLRLRSVGNDIIGELSVDVPRTLPLENVGAIKEQILDAIHTEFPDTTLTVSTHPRVLETETIQERILLIALRRKVPVHHVIVQNIGDKLSVSLDLEVDGRMKLEDAHRIASSFEKTIREEFGSSTEVETHIEPLEAAPLSGRDADEKITGLITEALKQLAVEHGPDISDIHHVRVRENHEGLIVNYHCRTDKNFNVAHVHGQVDKIEYGLRNAFPRIVRVIGHTDLKK